MVDFIQHQRVKDLLANAEQDLVAGNYKTAVTRAGFGLSLALTLVEARVLGPKPLGVNEENWQTIGLSIAADNGDIVAVVAHLRYVLLLVIMGIDMESAIRCRQITGTFYPSNLDAQYFMHGRSKEQVDRAEAEFVVSFCTDSVIRIESRVGSLEDPFGCT